MKKMVSVLEVVALPWARWPNLLKKIHVHTAMCFGCLMRSWHSYMTSVSKSIIEDARGVIGKLGSVVMKLLMIAG